MPVRTRSGRQIGQGISNLLSPMTGTSDHFRTSSSSFANKSFPFKSNGISNITNTPASSHSLPLFPAVVSSYTHSVGAIVEPNVSQAIRQHPPVNTTKSSKSLGTDIPSSTSTSASLSAQKSTLQLKTSVPSTKPYQEPTT